MKLFSFFLFSFSTAPSHATICRLKRETQLNVVCFFLIIPLDFSRCLLLSRQVCFFINYYYQAACCPSITERKNTFFFYSFVDIQVCFLPSPAQKTKKGNKQQKIQTKRKKKENIFFSRSAHSSSSSC